jgi:hypothetical protein
VRIVQQIGSALDAVGDSNTLYVVDRGNREVLAVTSP